MRPFITSQRKEYMLLVVDYVSKWIECIVRPPMKLKSYSISFIFIHFGTLKAKLSNEGMHYYNRIFSNLLTKSGIKYQIATTYLDNVFGLTASRRHQIDVSKFETTWTEIVHNPYLCRIWILLGKKPFGTYIHTYKHLSTTKSSNWSQLPRVGR